MPDLTANSALDVVIGLAFVFFTMSIVASAINEVIAAALNMRARTLEAGLRELLSGRPGDAERPDEMSEEKWAALREDLAAGKNVERPPQVGPDEWPALRDRLLSWSKWDDFRGQVRWTALKTPKLLPLLTLGRRNGRWSLSRSDPLRRPSYVPPRVFAMTLLDMMAPSTRAADTATMKEAKKATDGLPDGYLKRMMTDALETAGTERDRFVAEIEGAFDELMDRLSGRYKRWSQVVLIVIGLAVAGALNVDSFSIADHLYTNQAVREAVASEAAQAVEDGAIDRCVDEATTEGGETDGPSTAQLAADCVAEVDQLGLPLGWAGENTPDDAWGSLGKALGLLVTAFAITLGAPFWFDLLGKFARLRATGKREGTGKSGDRAAVDRDDRSSATVRRRDGSGGGEDGD